MDVGPAELLIVLVIALVLFGGKKIPDLARSLGQAKNEFEKGARGDKPEADPAAPVEVTADKADAEA
jgi:sec-independent protein translocase protein TatA